MHEIIDAIMSLGGPFAMVVFIVLIATASSVIGAIAKEIRKFADHRQDVEFKRELVDRGMTADEIERIVQAKGTGPTTISET